MGKEKKRISHVIRELDLEIQAAREFNEALPKNQKDKKINLDLQEKLIQFRVSKRDLIEPYINMQGVSGLENMSLQAFAKLMFLNLKRETVRIPNDVLDGLKLTATHRVLNNIGQIHRHYQDACLREDEHTLDLEVYNRVTKDLYYIEINTKQFYTKLDVRGAAKTHGIVEDEEDNEDIFDIDIDITPETLEASRELISPIKDKNIFIYISKVKLRDILLDSLKKYGDEYLSPSLIARREFLECNKKTLVHDYDVIEYEKLMRFNLLGEQINNVAKDLNFERKVVGFTPVNLLLSKCDQIRHSRNEVAKFIEALSLLNIKTINYQGN